MFFDRQVEPYLVLILWLVLGPSRGGSSDTSGKVWSVYLSEADKHDKALADNWKGDSEGILIFVRPRLRFGQIFPLILFKRLVFSPPQ